MAAPIVEGFSLSHAAILDGDTGAEEIDGDIYGIRSGKVTLNQGNFDNTGDDSVLSAWFWFNFADVEVTSGYVPFSTISLLSGNDVTSSGAAPNDFYSLPLWSESSLNTPTRPMYLRVPSKDSLGNVRSLEFVLYRVQFHPFSFDGPDYKAGLLLHYAGRAMLSNFDETGAALADRAIGRLISRPAV